jgi:DNA-binding CsgD family transcriptional regulator
MRESIQAILLSGTLITGIIAIMLSNRLARKYKLPYLNSYFYYLIFLFIFGIYGIIGAGLIRVFLVNQGLEAGAIESTCQLISFLGIPFLALAWYMFLRMSYEMVNRQMAPAFNYIFLGVLSLAVIGFGLLLAERELLGENPDELIRKLMLAGFSFMTLVVYAWSLALMFIHTGSLLDMKDRSNIRLFGLIYAVFTLGTTLLLNLSHMNMIFGFGFIIMLFAIHLIPIFFLSMYLDKNFVESVATQDFNRSLAAFIGRFDISKRESEIIELICKGKSNQDISDSLFISLQTVKDHIHRIYLKTGVKNRVQLTNLIRSFS